MRDWSMLEVAQAAITIDLKGLNQALDALYDAEATRRRGHTPMDINPAIRVTIDERVDEGAIPEQIIIDGCTAVPQTVYLRASFIDPVDNEERTAFIRAERQPGFDDVYDVEQAYAYYAIDQDDEVPEVGELEGAFRMASLLFKP